MSVKVYTGETKTKSGKQSWVQCAFYGTKLGCNLYAKDTTYLDKELKQEQEKEKEWEKQKEWNKKKEQKIERE